MLKLRPHIEILSVEDSITSAVNWLQNNVVPDIIMMDVRLADGLSFEIFNKHEIKSAVIFLPLHTMNMQYRPLNTTV